MKSRQILFAAMILGAFCLNAGAEPKKTKGQVEAPSVESVLPGMSLQSSPVLSELVQSKTEVPLGPQDVLKSYELAMNMLADRTSADFSVIVQAQQTNQITREQAEYLLQQRYDVAMMQYQVLSALHDVLKHDMDEASQDEGHPLKTTNAGTVVVVPFPGSASGAR